MEEKRIIITFTGMETPRGTELCTMPDFENEPNTDHMMAAASIIAGEQAAMALKKRHIGWKKWMG